MTTPVSESIDAPQPAKPTSRWEDFIDIFHAPSSVYERRQNESPWPMIWIVTVLFTLVTVLTFNGISPVIETEMRAEAAKAMAKNPQMTQDMVDMTMKWQLGARRWGGVFFPLIVLVSAILIWIAAKVVGAKETFRGAMVVMTYASIIAILQAFLIGAQGLVMDVASMTSLDQLSFSAARFADKATTAPALYAFMKSLDLFGLWALAVMAIGVRITGKVDKNRAIAFAALWYGVSTLLMVAFAIYSAPTT